MRAIISDRDYEILSAYMDGQLSSGERSKLEERLRARPDLRTALEEMQKMRALLRQAPRRRAPRNFTLTPAMVGERKPRTSPWAGLFPVMSFTSALAALALVVIIALQLGPQQPQSVAMQQPQITAELPAAQAPAEAAPEVAREAPAQEDPAAGSAPAATGAAGTFATPQDQALPTETAAQEAAPQEAAPQEAAPKAPPAPTMTAAAEVPAQPAANALDATPTPDASLMAAAEAESTLPPVINWNGVPGIVGDAGGLGGMGGGPGDTMMGPGMATGLGGGGGGAPMGGGMDYPPGGVYLPPETVVESGEAQPLPTPTIAPTPSGEKALTGTGPILGVPSAEDGGQIIEREALARGEEPTPAAVAAVPEQPAEPPAAEAAAAEAAEAEAAGAPAVEESQAQQSARSLEDANKAAEQSQAAVQASAPEPARGVLGLSRQALLAVEVVLGLVALAAGGAALYLRRRRAGR